MERSHGYSAFIERMNIGGEENFRLKYEGQKAIERVDKLLETFETSMEDLLNYEGVPVEFKPLSLENALNNEIEEESKEWSTDSLEDKLLYSYWKEVKGIIVPEVYIGSAGPSSWPQNASGRRIHGVRFNSEYRHEITTSTAFNQIQLQDIVDDRHIEVIEVKINLNSEVIGQVITARDMFKRDYNLRTIEPVIISENKDPSLE